jgi:hypothetical protein
MEAFMLRFVLLTFLALCALPSAGMADPPPTFEAYETGIAYDGDLQEPALSPSMCENMDDDICFWNFRTALREGASEDGINFNGAFTIVSWGCGTSCRVGGVIDRTDGQVYPLPAASLGYMFDRGSSLLIVNPDPASYSSDGQVPDWLWREFYTFENGNFIPLHQDKGDASGDTTDLLDTPHPVNQEALKDQARLP